ncbi:MAG: hypothetical protein Unbinned2903contig1001_32 [Prokaryotic dsDNA virus sp.]|nr:MAG: hypothetical protein Unbinned2903contig1001_32 [Prokaryotic dsDNA virus sp.]
MPEERIYRKFDSILLPTIHCVEEDRGFVRCCTPELVLASSLDVASWKNDKTSAWIKLSDVSDTITFTLKKDGIATTYTPTTQSIVRETYGKFTTIDWRSVLASDGIGCYTLELDYSISGLIGSLTWGTYKLKEYSTTTSENTCRVRAFFNSYQEIEQIDFSDTNVESTFRFFGFIGNRQPNMEIDNLIYQNREMKKVIRENLNDYEILSDPICKEFTSKLVDLYLLSENDLYISDYNAHNHDYCIRDKNVIVKESPEIQYFEYARDAVVTCKVEDKFKDKRSYFK